MGRAELRGVVAMDGPSGTGKSTVARRLAAAFDAAYLDTGAMYRAVTLAVLRAGVDPEDADAAARAVGLAELTVGTDPRSPQTWLDGEEVSREIRGADVTAAVSAVSAIPEVRELMVAEQRRMIAAAGAIVVEGRDIGTVVVPDAGLKVYLTADAHARAYRRNAQDSLNGESSTVEAVRADVQRRDALDSGRRVAPLRKAEDAVELDTTDLDVAGVSRELNRLVERSGLTVTREGTRQ